LFGKSKEERNWLVLTLPRYNDNPLDKPDDTVFSHADFTQECGLGHVGGTLARKLLTKSEAYAMAERLAENERTGTYDIHYRYFPIQLTDQFYKEVFVSSKVNSLPYVKGN